MRDFLLEIGVEETPALHIQPAVDFIKASFEQTMRDADLVYSSLETGSTPRRFYLLACAMQETQPDQQIKKLGPAVGIAYDKDGNLLPAALGFLRKNSAESKDLSVETNDRGDFLALNYLQKGRATQDVLKDWITGLFPRIPFAKTMIWNETRLAFSRPLRWLCALWGAEVIPLEVAGISSDNTTFGNRYLGLHLPLKINSPSDYLEILRTNAVFADRNERRALIVSELTRIQRETGLKVIPDERLIDTVTDLVENPSAVVAEFAPLYLELPEKIITSTISQNQKYFSVLDMDGRMSNKFVFISNGDPAYAQIIRRGNEKVVAARLADALWYYREDTKVALEAFLPRLKDVVFQSKLGTLEDKTLRISKIAEYICSSLKINDTETKLTLRTAQLCKADLVTTMLGEKEFAKLQGYVGKQYALSCGEDPEVAEGIHEHYMPRGTNDGLPGTLCGAVVAVADKLDTVCGIIGIGLVPTGSADPFALRRAANGVVQIINERNWQIDLMALLQASLELIRLKTVITPTAESDIWSFLLLRVEWILKQQDIDYDVISSVTALPFTDLIDLRNRALALQAYRTREDFLRLVTGFKRVSNIIAGETAFADTAICLLTEPAERTLYSALHDLRQAIQACIDVSDYNGAIALLVRFGVLIDRFFDEVLVNCDDMNLRGNRHALLNDIRSVFLRVADISRIVLDTES